MCYYSPSVITRIIQYYKHIREGLHACLSDIGNSVVNFPSNVANNLFLNRKLIYSLLIARLQIFNLSDCWYTPSEKS